MPDREAQFFRSVNYQKMLHISEDEAMSLATLNLQKSDQMNHTFEQRAKDGKNNSVSFFFENVSDICQKIVSETDTSRPCLFALFHFGDHISIPVDLAMHGLPVTLPVAGEPFEMLYSNRQRYCEELRENLDLLQVEDRATAAKMLKAIKQQRHICIYIDGNMGQDGVHVDRGGEQINFFDFKIRVKQTIQKLAKKYNLEVVPLFSAMNQDGRPMISMGEVIPPDRTTMMQDLYLELQKRIRIQPENWFYVQCLHRWLVDEHTEPRDMQVSTSDSLSFNPSHARLYNKGDSWFIVNYLSQRAILIEPNIKEDVLDNSQQGFKDDFLDKIRTKSSPESQRFISSLIKENLVSRRTEITN